MTSSEDTGFSDISSDEQSSEDLSSSANESEERKQVAKNENADSETESKKSGMPGITPSTQDISTSIQVIKDRIIAHWLRVDIKSDESPQELLKKVRNELNKPSSPCKIPNILEYELFHYQKSRFIKMYLQSVSANQITQANNNLLFLNKFITINIVLPNFIILVKQVDGSEKLLETISTLSTQLGITSSEEFSFFVGNDELCDYSKLPVCKSITPEDLKKFELPDHNIVKMAGYKVDTDSKVNNPLLIYHHLQLQKLMLNLSFIEQGITDGMNVVLRFDSTSMVQVFTSSETIRRNFICYQIYSDIINKIYIPGDAEECYKFAGIFLAINYASLQKHQLDPRSHTFKDELKEAIQYLEENGGKSSNHMEKIELQGTLVEFKKKDHPLHKTLKSSNRCILKLIDNGNTVELCNSKDDTIKLEMSNSEIDVNFLDYALNSKDAKASGHKKEVALKLTSLDHSFTVKPDYTVNCTAIINFVTGMHLLHISHNSEIQHVDFQEAENVIKELLAAKSETFVGTLTEAEQSTARKNIGRELVVNDETRYLNKEALGSSASSQTHIAQIKKIAEKRLEESMMVDKNEINLISHTTFLKNYLNGVVLSKNHIESLKSNTSPAYRAHGKEGLKPQELRFSFVFYMSYVKIIFIKPSGEKYAKVPSSASIPYKHIKGWKFDTALVTFLVDYNQNLTTFNVMMEGCGFIPENNRFNIIVETEDSLPYSMHQLIAERILQHSRRSNKRDYNEKITNYLNRGIINEHRRMYKNTALNQKDDFSLTGSRKKDHY